MTQRELAAKSGVSQVAISHIETKTDPEKNPRRSTQRVLAWALDYTVDDVFPPKGKRSPSAELRRIEKRERARNRRT
jgi:transcriptional regulator with XRE-family HTH domain